MVPNQAGWPGQIRLYLGVALMANTVREIFGVFDSEGALDDAVYTLETHGFDRAALSILASEEAVVKKLGHRYRQVKDVEDEPTAPRETFFSRVSRLEADYLPTPVLASMGALAFAGIGPIWTALVAAGAGAALGALLSRILHQHHATLIREQLERGGLLLWINVRNPNEEQTALEVLKAYSAHDIHAHDLAG
jgi:hypothetical protein